MHNVVVLQFADVLSLYKMIAWVRKPFAFILHLNIRKRERERERIEWVQMSETTKIWD